MLFVWDDTCKTGIAEIDQDHEVLVNLINDLYEAMQDGRPFFIIPWDDYYLVGTTDIFFNEDLNNVTATEVEISYLLKELNP